MFQKKEPDGKDSRTGLQKLPQYTVPEKVSEIGPIRKGKMTMDVLEISAKTVDEAIEEALEEMGITREEVQITVLSEGKSGGLFGIGAEDARVRVERLSPQEAGTPPPPRRM